MSEMGRLEFATPKEAWGGEAAAFTPRLATDEMLEYLGDETGIGAMGVVDVEHSTAGHRSLDILAETADGRRVAIENQYGVADHDHLTRGLAYAVATDSAGLIVIAEDHRDEFISVANYLNDVAGQAGSRGIRVWLVQVRAVRRAGDAVWSPEFVVKAEPNEWETSVRRETSPILEDLDDFYEKCADFKPEWGRKARTIMQDWLERPGAREFHGNVTTVSLYYPTPAYGSGGTNVFQLTTNGMSYVCRGHIWQSSGVFAPDQPPEDLDDNIKEHFPEAIWGGKQYYLRIPDPNPERVSAFLDWLTATFDAAMR